MDDHEKAGKIAAEVLVFGKKLIKEGAVLGDVSNKVEEKIKKLKGEIAFPCQISINEVAAHYCPDFNDMTVIKKGDLVKLDLGVHVKGKIADTACSIDVGGDKNLELIKASKDALKEATDLMRPGVKLNEIGKAVEEVIVGQGFNPIRNLSGHEVSDYELHAGLTVPNYDDGDETELKENQVFAVEPFATTGDGYIKDSKNSGIYKLLMPKNVRSGRDILNYVMKEYKSLPFARKWLLKKFSGFKLNFGLRILEKEEIVLHYKQLVERSNGLVSQAENTIIVKDKPVVLTKV